MFYKRTNIYNHTLFLSSTKYNLKSGLNSVVEQEIPDIPVAIREIIKTFSNYLLKETLCVQLFINVRTYFSRCQNVIRDSIPLAGICLMLSLNLDTLSCCRYGLSSPAPKQMFPQNRTTAQRFCVCRVTCVNWLKFVVCKLYIWYHLTFIYLYLFRSCLCQSSNHFFFHKEINFIKRVSTRRDTITGQHNVSQLAHTGHHNGSTNVRWLITLDCKLSCSCSNPAWSDVLRRNKYKMATKWIGLFMIYGCWIKEQHSISHQYHKYHCAPCVVAFVKASVVYGYVMTNWLGHQAIILYDGKYCYRSVYCSTLEHVINEPIITNQSIFQEYSVLLESDHGFGLAALSN